MSDSDDSSIDSLTNDQLLKQLLKNRSNVRIKKCLYDDQYVEHSFNVKLMEKPPTNDSGEQPTKISVNKSPRETINAPTQVPVVEIMLPTKAAKRSIPRKVENSTGTGLNKPMTPHQILKHSRFDRRKLNNFSTPKQPNKLCTFTCPVSPITREVKSSTSITPPTVENSRVNYINDNRKSEYCCVHSQTRVSSNQKANKSEYMSFGSLRRGSITHGPHNNNTNKKTVSMSISNEQRLSNSSISSDSSVEIPDINNETATQLQRSFGVVCSPSRVLKFASSNSLNDASMGCTKMNLTVREPEINEIQHVENKENNAILSESMLTQESLRLSSQIELDVTKQIFKEGNKVYVDQIESNVEKFQNVNKGSDNILASITKENLSNAEIGSRNGNLQQISEFISESLVNRKKHCAGELGAISRLQEGGLKINSELNEPITNDKFNLDVPDEKGISEQVRNLNAIMRECSAEDLSEREMNNSNAEPNKANTKTNLIKGKSTKIKRSKRRTTPIKKTLKRNTSRKVKSVHLSSEIGNEPESMITQESLRSSSRMELDVREQIHKDNTDCGNKVYVDQIESDVEKFQNANKGSDNILPSITKENVSNAEIGSRNGNLQQIGEFISESLVNRKKEHCAGELGAISRLQEGGLKSNSELNEPITNDKFNLDVPDEKGISEQVRNLNAIMRECSAEDLSEREMNNSNAEPNKANTKTNLIKGKSTKIKRSKRRATPIKKTLKRNTSRKDKSVHLSSGTGNEPDPMLTQEFLRSSSRMELDVTYVDQIASDVEKFQNANKGTDNLLAIVTKVNVPNAVIGNKNDNPGRELGAIPRLRTSTRTTRNSSRNVKKMSVTGELNKPLPESPQFSDRVNLGKTDSVKSNKCRLNVSGTVGLRQSVRLIQKKLNIQNSDINFKPQQKTSIIKTVASSETFDPKTSERSPPLIEAQVNINSKCELSLNVNNTGRRLSTHKKQKIYKTGNETHSKSSKIKCIAISPHEVQHDNSRQSDSSLSDLNEHSVIERPRDNAMSSREPRRSSRVPKPLFAFWMSGARRLLPVIRDINQLDDAYDSKIPIILLPPKQLSNQSMNKLLQQIKKRMVFKK